MLRLFFFIQLLLLCLPLQAREFVIGLNQRDVYRFKDEQNKWVGIDIDLINAVAKRTPYTFKYIEMTWPRVLKSIESGEVDLALSTSVTEDRQQYALFTTESFRFSFHMLFVRKSKLESFKSVSKLSDLTSAPVTIGALRGAIYSNAYQQLLSNEDFTSRIAFIDNDKLMPKFVLKGRVDGYIESEVEGKAYLNKNPAFQNEIVPLIYLNEADETSGKLMFSKKTVSQEVVDIFDIALKELHESGEYQAIMDKY